MTVHNFSDAICCKVFPTTLAKAVQEWYRGLPRGSIVDFEQLAAAFLLRFASSRQPGKGTTSLFSIKQGKEETLRAYSQRFNMEKLQIPDLQDNLAVAAYQKGLWSRQLISSLAMHPVTTLSDLMERAGEHIRAEEAFLVKKDENKDKELAKKVVNDKGKGQNNKNAGSQKDRQPGRVRFKPFKLTPLNTPRGQILMEIRMEHPLPPLPKMQGKPEQRSRTKFCRFHSDYGHDIDECRELAQEIDALIRRGHLRRYVEV